MCDKDKRRWLVKEGEEGKKEWRRKGRKEDRKAYSLVDSWKLRDKEVKEREDIKCLQWKMMNGWLLKDKKKKKSEKRRGERKKCVEKLRMIKLMVKTKHRKQEEKERKKKKKEKTCGE